NFADIDPYSGTREAVPPERFKRKKLSRSGKENSALASMAPATPARAVVVWCVFLGCPTACSGPKVVMVQPLSVPYSEMFLQRAWNRIEDLRKVGIWLGDAKP
ncbi:hypothetical protein B0T20DRAFT_358089, partial [Sordaria brevicollis]